MKILLSFVVLVCFFQKHPALGLILSDFKQIDKNLWTGKGSDGVYFAMERIDQSKKRQAFWKKYAFDEYVWKEKENPPYIIQYEDAEKNLPRHKKYEGLVRSGEGVKFSDGIDTFQSLLRDGYVDNEAWVAFASKSPIGSLEDIKAENIEMVVCVLTDVDAPMTSHMGIAKSFHYMLEALKEWDHNDKRFPLHADLSMYLHSFAAKVMKKLYNNKLYMITAPVPLMAKIIQKKLGKENVFVMNWDDEEESEEKDVSQDPIVWNPDTKKIGDYIIYDKNHEKAVFKENSVEGTIELGEKKLKGEEAKKRFKWWHHGHMSSFPKALIDLQTLADYMKEKE